MVFNDMWQEERQGLINLDREWDVPVAVAKLEEVL